MFSIIPNQFVSKLEKIDDSVIIDMIRSHFLKAMRHTLKRFDYRVEVTDNRVVSIPNKDKTIYIKYIVYIGERPTEAVIPIRYNEYQDILSDRTSRIREIRIDNILD